MPATQTNKNILVLLGHPDDNSFCGLLANSYADTATAAGHSVKYIKLGELDFDPILHQGYKTEQPLEPDLIKVQAHLTWAEHIALVYPIWWGAMPALLKGLFDRVLLPGYAYQFRPHSQFWDKLLTGRSAHVITTMDTPPWFYRLGYRWPGHNQIRRTILEFCGIKPVKITSFGPIKSASDKQLKRWQQQVIRFANQVS